MSLQRRSGERVASPAGVAVLHVAHSSMVAAIPTADGPARLLEMGIHEAIADAGLPVQVVQITPSGSVLGEVAVSFEVANRIASEVRNAKRRDCVTVILAGSCHVGIGAIAGMATGEAGIIWLDCHGDFNTPETTESGLLDGTTLASVTGRCWRQLCSSVDGFEAVPEANVVLIGTRDLDAEEATLLAESQIATVPSGEALGKGINAIDALRDRVGSIYVHIDLDVLDPSVGTANAFATPGGLDAHQFYTLLEHSIATGSVDVISFTSYDPGMDTGGAVGRMAVEAARRIGASAGRRL